jgi:hypothetical protein
LAATRVDDVPVPAGDSHSRYDRARLRKSLPWFGTFESRLTECIDCRYELAGAAVVLLPHPSGESGWLNDPANRERLDAALELLGAELNLARP